MINYDAGTDEATEGHSDDEHADQRFTPPSGDESCPHYREGKLFENATLEASRFVQVDYEMAVASALGVVAACCQGLVDVAYPNGHTVPTSLMIMTLAGVSEGKTSLDNEFSRPIREFEKQKDKDRQEEVKRYQRNLDIWKQKEKTLNKALSKLYAEGEETAATEQALHDLDKEKPERPLSYRFIYERATPSALLHSLYENLPLGYFLSDEAGSLLMGPAFDDINQFNSLWSGSDIPVDRRTSDSFLLTNARLSVNLMMQPAIFQRFMENKRGQHAYESGFFARFLISNPMPSSQTTLSERSPGDDMKQFHERALKRLSASISACQAGEPRTALEFNGTATETWRKIYQKIKEEEQNGRAYMLEKGHAKKLMDNISRVAALLHTFENDSYEEVKITEKDLVNATSLVRHFSGHYMRELAQEPEIVTLADKMIYTIRNRGDKKEGDLSAGTGDEYTFVMSKIKQYSHPDIRSTEGFDRAISFLEDLGHVQKKRYGRDYVFRETIVLDGYLKPAIKNGELYYVKTLPKFADQVVLDEGRGPSYYAYKNTRDR
ncbi:YfjI family protein [Marinobacter sp. ATCH36]|uniref:YfjI family protein n=1 Tax=Marinobacter sp. ATCH36 TaxID=2945106 RepID=UPI00201FEF1B|nr:YfjI family protein [Marinobacter sp. ATCH36]MCL7946179.1 YfjI family protein [Marinobacter sp. ATCH36]